MLLGGKIDYACSNRVFLSKLNKEETDAIWDELIPMEKPRSHHVAFKIQKSVYAAGG